MNAIEIKNLTKRYKGFTLDNLSLSLPNGCILGLIGENGAGKSTTIKLLLDMIHKDEGSIRIFGKENTDSSFALAKEDIGVVLDEVGIPECLNTKQIGKIMKNTYKNWDSATYEQLLYKFSLPENKEFKDFSKGTKMKMGIAIALSHNSKLLILDEATAGLDPVARDEVVEMLEDFTREENHSVLISSHIVSDLEKICDYVAFLHKGKLLLYEEKDRLLEEYGLIHCAKEKIANMASEYIKYKKENPYGVDAIVLRSGMPADVEISPISIEELFVVMAKEAR